MRVPGTGINMYKNLRIIEEDKKDIMGLRGYYQHERGIYGEIFLNDFDTDHAKTQFLRTDQWYEFEKILKNDPIIKDWLKKARHLNSHTTEATPITKNTQEKVDNILKKMTRHINKNKLLDGLNFNSVDKSLDTNESAKMISGVSSPPSSTPQPPKSPTPKSPANNSSGAKTKPPALSFKWRAGDVVFDIKHHVEDLNNIECIKEWDLINETTLNVVINNGGKVYNAWQEKTAFITQEIVQSFIECLVNRKEVSHSRAFELRENILNSAH